VVIKSFREYLDKLRSAGELVEINEEVSVDLEVAALLRQLMYSGGPAMIIRRTRERTLPIVGNLFGKWDRVAMVMEGRNLGDAISELTNMINFRAPGGLLDALKSLSELRRYAQYFPKFVTNGSVRKYEWREGD